jgi:homoserine O-acetyltransferase
MVANIPSVEYSLIDSPFGHDGFLVEYEQLDTIIKEFMMG